MAPKMPKTAGPQQHAVLARAGAMEESAVDVEPPRIAIVIAWDDDALTIGRINMLVARHRTTNKR